MTEQSNRLGLHLKCQYYGYYQATGMTKISRGGGVFSKIFRPGGVFYRKFRILTGSRVFSLIKP